MATPAPNVPEYTVSGISAALKRTVEDAYGWVRVRGEISGYKGPHSSGHAYFTLKDDKARLDAVVWRTSMLRIKFKPEEGLEVIATGKLSTFPGKSNYQMIIETLEPAGVGSSGSRDRTGPSSVRAAVTPMRRCRAASCR